MFHLVVDEIVAVANHRFRVQVWRRADAQPVVLLSQVQGDVPLDWYSSAIANLVVSAFLGYSATIPTFFEVSRWNGAPCGFRVSFDTIGFNLRPILITPHYTPMEPAVVERVFGRKRRRSLLITGRRAGKEDAAEGNSQEITLSYRSQIGSLCVGGPPDERYAPSLDP